MVAMKKKELVLAAAAMSNEEFEVLRQDRERRQQITDQESLAPQQKKGWLLHWRLPSMQLQREQRGVFRSV